MELEGEGFLIDLLIGIESNKGMPTRSQHPLMVYVEGSNIENRLFTMIIFYDLLVLVYY